MQPHLKSSFVVGVGLMLGLAACSPSPTAPATGGGSPLSTTATTTVNTAVQQAVTLSAASMIAVAPTSPLPPAFTYPCPEGGTITTTFSSPLPVPPGGTLTAFALTAHTEFQDCRAQGITMRGDPALTHTTQYEPAGSSSGGAPTSVTATTQTSGAVRVTANGVETRVRYDCASVMVLQLGSPSLPQFTATGTITWESPVGTVTRTSGCGMGQ